MRKCLCIPGRELEWWVRGVEELGRTYRFPADDSFEEDDLLLVGPLVDSHCKVWTS